jgi:hypothetical protein
MEPAVRRRFLGVLAIVALVGCSDGGATEQATTTTAAPSTTSTVASTTTPPTTATATTTAPPTTTTTTTTVPVVDSEAAQIEVAGAGDRWIAGHEVTLDQAQTYSEVSLQVATEHDSIWASILGTDEGNAQAVYTALAICTWVEEATPQGTILNTVVTAATPHTDDSDELLFFAGLAVSGAANVFCPELSDAVRQIVPQT